MACVGLFAAGCGPSGYYYEASDGRVACAVDEMYIKEPETFGTREWQVKCVEGLHKNKVFDCEGTKTNAKCVERKK